VIRQGVERLLLLRRSLFVRHASILSLGQMSAAGISMLGLLVLGRLYTPAEFATLGTYMAVSVALTSIGNWQYSLAVIIEGSERRAFALVRLCAFTSLITALIAGVVAAVMMLYPFEAPELHAAGRWMMLLPVTVFGSGLIGAWSALANRRQAYRFMAFSQAATALLTVLVSIGLGFAGFGGSGPMISFLAGQAFLLAIHAAYFLSLKDRPRGLSTRRLLAVARRHYKFALWTTPSTFVGSVFIQSPQYALALMNSPALLGAFSRGKALLVMPTQLVGGAVGQVFRQRAAADVAANGHCLPLFNKAFWGLVLLGAPPLIFLMIFAPALFAFFIGPDWRIAGDIARILAPMLFLELICAPIATVFHIRGRQTEDFVLQTVFGAITGALVLAPVVLGYPAITVIYAYAIGQSLLYGWYIVRSRQLAGPQT
jgi:O-antigen/teichoic acid export membrane protein